MSYPTELDGPRLYNWAARAVTDLSARRAEINELNVFPVPDSDTGSNMTHTMEAALERAGRLSEDDRADVVAVARALAHGSVRGARGNSGVVLSQVLRGLAEGLAHQPVDGSAVARSLQIAVTLVVRAISDPVEGTVVTVLRASAVAATETVDDGGTLRDVAAAAVDAARTALAQTPSQLAVLREAGVVDAGAAGFLVLMEALLREVENNDETPVPTPEVFTHGREGNLEVMFFFAGDLDELEQALEPLGDSLLLARASEGSATVHIHSRLAGRVIEEAFARGEVSDLRLEVLPVDPRVDGPPRAIIAVTPPGPIAGLYRQAGAEVLELAGEDDELVSDVLACIRASGADEIIFLSNGLLDRRQLAAVDKATHAFEQAIVLVPTSRVVAGIAALTVHDDDEPLATTAATMAEASSAMRTAVAVEADRAGLTAAGPCAKGDFLVESDSQVIAIADTCEQAVEAAARRLLASGGEQVTVLTAGEIDDHALASRLHVDVLVFPGDGLKVAAEIGVE